MDQELIALRFDFLPAKEFMTSKEFAYAMGWTFDAARVHHHRHPNSPPAVQDRPHGRVRYRTSDVMKFMESLPATKKQRLKTYHDEQRARTYRMVVCQPSA